MGTNAFDHVFIFVFQIVFYLKIYYIYVFLWF